MITPDKSDSIIFSTPRFDVIREAHEGRDYYYVEKPNTLAIPACEHKRGEV